VFFGTKRKCWTARNGNPAAFHAPPLMSTRKGSAVATYALQSSTLPGASRYPCCLSEVSN